MLIKEYCNKSLSYNIINSTDNHLSNLKKINIFVGANNSGKSRFLREIFKGTAEDFVFFDDVNNKLIEILKNLQPRFKDLFYMKNLIELTKSRTGNYIERFNNFYKQVTSINNASHSINNISDLTVAKHIVCAMSQHKIDKELKSDEKIDRRHIYIPILRGLRHLDSINGADNKSDLYMDKTIKDYSLHFSEDVKNIEIFSGLSVYKEIKKMLLGSKKERDFVENFEKFLSESFFQGKTVTLISDYHSDNLKINIEGKEDRAICDVGDGIQAIIINTFTAFKYQDEEILLFMEEPEMTMHPAVQRVLIKTLTSKFNNIQVFLTTHSNHFLDLAYDYPNEVSIFSFEENSNEEFNIRNVTDNSKILDLLGIRNSSVFLSNCVIWTEGVTDRMLLKGLIEMEKIDFKEDYHYAFAEYGGSNLENFDFIGSNNPNSLQVNAITRNNYIIADNDGITVNTPGNSKFKRRKNIEKVLGKEFFFDKHVEIENLIPYKVWLEVVKLILQEKKSKEIELKEVDGDIESEFNNGLKNNKIGILLKKYIIKSTLDGQPKYFKNDSVLCIGETKKDIMEYVLQTIKKMNLKISDFPKMTQSLIKSIKDFVKTANGKL